jgi:hypothetical protein
MRKQPRPCEATSQEAHLTRRDLLSYALSIGGASALTALWPRSPALAAGTAAQAVSRYLVYIGGAGAVIDSLIDMQQVAAPPTQAPPTDPTKRLRVPMLRQAPPASATMTQIHIAMGWNPPKPFADWVAAAVHVATPQNGSLFVTDANMNVREAYNWFGGTISRIDLPACDAASTLTTSPVLTIQAPQLTQVSTSGPPPGQLSPQSRVWRQQNFGLTSTAPITESLKRTLRVGAIALGPTILGGTVDITMGFGPERPDLLGPFQTALQHGGQLMAQPTDVTVHLLTPDMRLEMATVILHACRILALNVMPPPAGTRALPTTTATLAFADASLAVSPA